MKKYILPTIILATSILLSIFFYPALPDLMASHWNISGVADGYSVKLANVILFPALQTVFLLLMIFIPRLDPKAKNIKEFESKYYVFINAFLIFFTLLQLQVFLWNTDIKLSMNTVMPILVGALFLVTAYLIKDAKQNYTIGIRTPWTLASKSVWDKTHKLGAKLFALSGVLSIAASMVPSYSFVVILSTILISTVVVVVYSYVEYKKD